jgi:peptidase E
VICSTHLSLRYESLIYRLFSVKSTFFKLDVMSNIIKCLDIVIVGKVNTHVLLIAWKRADNSLDLLFISHLTRSKD